MSTIPVQKRPPRTEENVDDAIEDSFPASDPPSYSRTARSGNPPRGAKLTQVDCDESEKDHDAKDPDAKDQDAKDEDPKEREKSK